NGSKIQSLPFLTENQRQEVYDGLIAEAQNQPMPSEERAVKVSILHPGIQKPSCPLAALLGGERYGGGAQPKTNTQENQAKEQMTCYKEADLLEVKEDPLVWWKEHQVFSTAGDIVTAQRSALLPDHVDQIIFLNKNLKRM
ncbi:hypothetical protein KUCAC02_037360, partial [Chaenocephalus aceratus]